MEIRSSGWKTDMVVTVPEAVMLGYVWVNIMLALPDYQPYAVKGGVLLAAGGGLLLSASALLGARFQRKESYRTEEEKIRSLDLEEEVIVHALSEHKADEQKWEEMVRSHAAPQKEKVSNDAAVFWRTLVFFMSGFLLSMIPLFFQKEINEGLLHIYGILLIVSTGMMKYGLTGRNIISGAFRYMLTGLVIYSLAWTLSWLLAG